jgi:hypothetical protein
MTTAEVELEMLLSPTGSSLSAAKELIKYVFMIEISTAAALLLSLETLFSMLIIDPLFLGVA